MKFRFYVLFMALNALIGTNKSNVNLSRKKHIFKGEFGKVCKNTHRDCNLKQVLSQRWKLLYRKEAQNRLYS